MNIYEYMRSIYTVSMNVNKFLCNIYIIVMQNLLISMNIFDISMNIYVTHIYIYIYVYMCKSPATKGNPSCLGGGAISQ